MRRATALALLAAALVVLAPASLAFADGDPASDYLLANQVFVTSPSGSLSPAQRELVKLVAATNHAGYPIRVAVISGPSDLGSLPELWRKPSFYAHFLGEELSLAYKQRLLIVMPNGFGFNWPGHSSGPELSLLSKVAINGGRDGLAVAAQKGVRDLAAAADITPVVSNTTPVPTSGSAPAALIVIIGLLCVLTALGIVFVRARRRPATVGRPSLAPRGPLPLKLHIAIVTFVVLFAAGVAVVVVIVTRGKPSSKQPLDIPTATVSSAQARSVVTPPPYSWPKGRRPAPVFSLRDQAGRPVALEAYRGRPVILTFLDPVCRNVCPLEAQVINQALARMPVSQRPQVVAVSVDVYADTRADLLKDVRKWNLLPQWRWAVGSPAQLAAVWRHYEVEVSVAHEQVAGKRIVSVTHTAAAYVIDSRGDERALFLWPFYPQDVERVLHELSSKARPAA